MNTKYFEDFETGETFTSSARTVTEADLVNYAGISGNYDPVHMDADMMADSEFGGRLVHGFLILAVMEGQKVGTGIIEGSVKAFYGFDGARFTNPVLVGDTIHTEITVLDLEDTDDDAGVVVFEEKAVNQDGDPVVVAETRTLFYKGE